MSNPHILAQGTEVFVSKNEVASVALAKSTPESDLVALGCTAKTVQYQGGSADEIDVTVLCSTAKEFALGLSDSGTMSISGHWKQDDEGHILLKKAASDKKPRLIKVVFNDGTSFYATGLIKQRSWNAQTSGVVTSDVSIRLTGATLEDETPAGTATSE